MKRERWRGGRDKAFAADDGDAGSGAGNPDPSGADELLTYSMHGKEVRGWNISESFGKKKMEWAL